LRRTNPSKQIATDAGGVDSAVRLTDEPLESVKSVSVRAGHLRAEFGLR
jgi:hypothetical protein